MSELTQRLVEGVRATGVAEWLAVFAGLVYIVLIIRRHRAGWIAGGISSLILAVLAVRARLPMQALLQAFYVGAALYGWWRWSPRSQPQRISTWHWRGHASALLLCLLASLGFASVLAREGYSAFPFMDSLVACAGLVATWLVARMHLENWLYWIAIDAVSVYLFAAQGLFVTALLFLLYLCIAVAGLHAWWKSWRAAQPPA
jgi:nicotinamide mononucleotide transporter